jgi:8-amino-7-oxononanoate synthase
MSAIAMFSSVLEAQKLKGPSMRDAPTFYQNLEERLDKRRAEQRMLTLRMPRETVDFSSSDFLSLSSSGLVRMAFFDELARHPHFLLGSSGSRLLDGNNRYVESLEQDLADFHGAEKGLMFNSGYDANGAIFTVIPQIGDAIVYDELIHASIHDGMRHTRASIKQAFLHNDVSSFRDVLIHIRDSQPQIKVGQSTVLVSIESVYSMDGDIAPAEELVKVAKEVLPLGNVQFVIDEAHSTGLIGKRGTGLVCALGLEKDFAIRLHTFGKALGSHGGMDMTSSLPKLS